MRRVIAMFGAAAVAVTSISAVPNAAVATTAPTISAPAVVRYWTQFSLSGTAPAGTSVQIFYRRSGVRTFAAGPTVTAASDGTWTYHNYIDTSYSYYAADGGMNSSVITVTVKPASCAISGPAVTSFPFTYGVVSLGEINKPFVAFTATRAGKFAGVAYDGINHLAVITWERGQPLRVLDRMTYVNTSYEPYGAQASVRVVGILPNGGVVAAVQPANTRYEDGRWFGYVYENGTRIRLSMSPHWLKSQPVGVTARGAIVGWDDAYDSAHQVQNAVQMWTSPTAAPITLARTGTSPSYPVVDGNGDVAYYTSAGVELRYASGQVDDMAPLPGGVNYFVEAAYGPSAFFGHSDGTGIPDGAITQWNVPATPTGSPIVPARVSGRLSSYSVIVAGPHAEWVVERRGASDMRTPSGTFARLNVQGVDVGENPGEVITESDALAFVSPRDSFPHFLNCK